MLLGGIAATANGVVQSSCLLDERMWEGSVLLLGV